MIFLKQLINEIKGPKISALKKNKKPLTDEEREKVMKAGAVWHPCNLKGKPTPAVQKAVVNGKTWYWCATHRYGVVKSTLKGAIAAFPEVRETS